MAIKHTAVSYYGLNYVEHAEAEGIFFYDFNRKWQEDSFTNVPLYHWQAQPKYIQLRGLLDRHMVEPALAMRIHHLVSHDEFTRTLKDIIVFESNLFEKA